MACEIIRIEDDVVPVRISGFMRPIDRQPPRKWPCGPSREARKPGFLPCWKILKAENKGLTGATSSSWLNMAGTSPKWLSWGTSSGRTNSSLSSERGSGPLQSDSLLQTA